MTNEMSLLLVSIWMVGCNSSTEKPIGTSNSKVENVEKKKRMKDFISSLHPTEAQKIYIKKNSPISFYKYGRAI